MSLRAIVDSVALRRSRFLAMALFLFALTGCASIQAPEYISRVDHPYDRKIYARLEKVVSSIAYVLKLQGWSIVNEVDPSTYERDDRYDNTGYQNLIIMTDVKQHFLTRTHLNILIHALGNTCDVEVRYESRTSLIKQFISTRNDKLVEYILDAVDQEASK